MACACRAHGGAGARFWRSRIGSRDSRGGPVILDFRFAIFAESGTVIAASGETNPSKRRPVDNYDRPASDYTGTFSAWSRLSRPRAVERASSCRPVGGVALLRGSSAQQMALVRCCHVAALVLCWQFAVARINRRLEMMALTKRVAAAILRRARLATNQPMRLDVPRRTRSDDRGPAAVAEFTRSPRRSSSSTRRREEFLLRRRSIKRSGDGTVGEY